MAASAPPKKAKDRYAPTAWGGEQLIDLEMPSGQFAQVRRPGVTGLIKAGLLDSLDSLTALVKTEHIDRVEKGETPSVTVDDIKALQGNKDKMMAAFAMMERVTEFVVVQPSVIRPVVRDEQGRPVVRQVIDRKSGEPQFKENGEPKTEEIDLDDRDRVPGQVYTDMVDLTDKVYLFQYVVGGVSDLEQFRQEFGETLGSLESL